jgi:hypothetical protein
MGRIATIEEYLAGLAGPLREIGEKLRPVIDEALPEAGSTVWHAAPTWSMGEAPGKAPVCYLKAYTSYLTFGFWRGQDISDPSGRLSAGAREMGQVKLRTVADVDVELFSDWLRQARELELAALPQN